jgi:hypothetical protein
MALTISEMQSLLAGKSKVLASNALVRTAGNNTLEQQLVKPSQFGKFEGKQGTKRRSRKGLVRTMPNGWVKYNDVTEIEVVAYKV